VKLGKTALLVVLGVASCCSFVAAQAAPSPIDSADSVFKAGKFADAAKLYGKIVDKNSKDVAAIQQLGYIALLGNQLNDAQKWLEKAIALKPDNSEAKIMLAEVFYRRNDFPKAAAILKQIGPSYPA
jgi:tetratricopeptide (TPR) repeat protein